MYLLNIYPSTNDGSSYASRGGPVRLVNSPIKGNTASGNGGGIVQANTFSYNFATLHYYYPGPLSLSGSPVENNSAGGEGGGLCSQFVGSASGGGDWNLSDSPIEGNTAGSGGGGMAIFVNAIQVTLSGSPVVGNATTNGDGGGIYSHSIFQLNNTAVSMNRASNGRGGGIYTTDPVEVLGTTVMTNSARVGGGIYSDRPNTFVSHYATTIKCNSSIVNSTATNGDGGGIYAIGRIRIARKRVDRHKHRREQQSDKWQRWRRLCQQ